MSIMHKKYMLLNGKAEEVLKTIPDNTFHTAITSPPYWTARDYFADGQLGWEATPEEYAENLVKILREVKRVLRDDGVLWLNIGDCYNNDAGFTRATKGWKRKGRNHGSADRKAIKHPFIKKKELVGVPWMAAFEVRKDGWYFRDDIVWEKTNPMPDGAKDRPCHGHEYLFMFSKSPRYYYDYYNSLEIATQYTSRIQRFGAKNQKGTFRQDQDRTYKSTGTRNRRSVWRTSVSSFKGDHFATFPPELIYPCIITATSDHGCCAECGKPYERKVTKEDDGDTAKYIVGPWTKACKCSTNEIKPCLVLDPFSGMATTGITAIANLRNYVGVELSTDYLKDSRKRINTPPDHSLEEVFDITEF